MWERTKRLINAYLDNLIEKTGHQQSEVQEVTRMEVARLNEVEVQARAAQKMLEKELAEVELKLIGISERQQIAQLRGDAQATSSAESELAALANQRDLLKKQIVEAQGSAERARSLREERRRQGQDLANESTLTGMRDNIAGVHSGFDPLDPSSTIEEMRSRIARPSGPTVEDRVAQADQEMEADRSRARVDELLARYKQSSDEEPALPRTTSPQTPRQTAPIPPAPQPAAPEPEKEEPKPDKTLGPARGPIRPID